MMFRFLAFCAADKHFFRDLIFFLVFGPFILYGVIKIIYCFGTLVLEE